VAGRTHAIPDDRTSRITVDGWITYDAFTLAPLGRAESLLESLQYRYTTNAKNAKPKRIWKDFFFFAFLFALLFIPGKHMLTADLSE